ncbi:hypothetical protein ABPG72_017259 [Tetrahymena utriculariae]
MLTEGLFKFCDILISNQISQEKQDEFKLYFNEIIQSYKRELKNQQEEDKFFQDCEMFKNMLSHKKIEQQIKMILEQFENTAQQRLQELIPNQLFDSQFVAKYVKLSIKNGKFFKNLKLQVDQEQNEEQLAEEIDKSAKEKDQQIREKYFSKLINKFISELSELYYNIFGRDRQQIQVLTDFQQQFKKINKIEQTQKPTLFTVSLSFEDLYQYSEKDQLHKNLSELCQMLGKQDTTNQILKVIKIWNSIFQFQNDDLILRIADILETDKESPKNKFLFEFIQKYLKISQQQNSSCKTTKDPIKKILEINLPDEIYQAYNQLQNQPHIYQNLINYKLSQLLIQKIQESKKYSFSLNDLRYFLGKDQHDLSVYLSSLNKFIPFLEYLGRQGQKSKDIIQDIINLNNMIESELVKYGCTREWKQVAEKSYKLEEISSGLYLKQSYLQFFQNFCNQGEIVISIPFNSKPSKVNLTCNGQAFEESKIKEIQSRILIEKKSKQQDPNNNIQLESNQLKIEKFQKQLDIVLDIQQKLQEMFRYGYFLFNQDIYLYKNSNGMYQQQNISSMKENLQQLENQLQSWKQKVKQTIQKFRKFSLICYSYYHQLHQYLKISNDQQILSKSLQQDSWQINSKILPEVTQENSNQYTNSNEKLEFIAGFVTYSYNQENRGSNNQEFFGEMVKENSNKIMILKFKDSEEAIDKLLQYEKQIENFKSQYFYFFDKHSKQQDLRLFLYRYQLLQNKEPINFYLIVSQKLKESQLQMIYDNRNSSNHLIILIQQECYNNYFSQFNNQQNQQGHQTENILNNFNDNAIFYVSSFYGVGKQSQIEKDIQVKRKNDEALIRFSINGNSNKQTLIQQLQQNMSEELKQKNYFHIDVYESEEIDLNFLLFEIIFLKSINFNYREYINLGSKSVFYFEINNSIQKSLEKKIKIKKFFQKKEINFDLQNLDIKILNDKGLKENTLQTFKYLLGLQDVKQCENYFDNQEKLKYFQQMQSVEDSKFKDLLYNYFIKYLIQENIVPNFQQVVNFISLFGSEMMKFEKSEYVSFQQTQILQSTLRSDIVKLSVLMCQRISMSCLKEDYQKDNKKDNQNKSNCQRISMRSLQEDDKEDDQNKLKIEQIQSDQAKKFIQFNKLLINFVTFQEQETPCLTSFFINQKDIPESIKKIYKKYKQDILVFDDKNSKSEDYKNWLITLFNQNIDTFYQNRGYEQSQENLEFQNYVKNLKISKDNFFKISAIYLRIRSNIPIILMGETGIGKTALIKFLTYVMNDIFIYKAIHSGVTEMDIIDMIKSLENEISKYQNNKKIILFFDEVNTSILCSGLFKEIIVDRHIKGKKIHKNIIPIAAINPYQLKTKEQKKIISYLTQEIYNKDTKKKFQSSDFEYNVFPIPLSMHSFIFNFGKLEVGEEDFYIEKMVLNTLQELQVNYKQEIDSSIKKI